MSARDGSREQREEFASALTHGVGAAAALAAGTILIALVARGGDGWQLGAAIVFGASLLLLYLASTLYHAARHPVARGRLKVFDHCAIYLLIAGSYTPFALVTLQGAWGWALLIAAWGAALFGIARELRPGDPPAPSLALYLGMGWLGVIAAVPLIARLDSTGLAWLMAGAVLYSAGTIFYRNPLGWRHAHGTWHLFVLAGTASHYVTVAHFVL